MSHQPSWRMRKNPFWKVGGTQIAYDTSDFGALFAFEATENIAGAVILSLPPGKKADHLGIKIQFIGRIDMVRRDDYNIPS
jgi:Vacuolar protein sorting-associated protein 26